MLFQRRHDLVGLIYSLIQPTHDDIIFEAFFDERQMPDMVATCARNLAVMQQLEKDFKDIGRFATATAGAANVRLAAGFEGRMEHKEAFEGVFLAEPTLRKVLTAEGNGDPEIAVLRKIFRYIHVSSEVHYEFAPDKQQKEEEGACARNFHLQPKQKLHQKLSIIRQISWDALSSLHQLTNGALSLSTRVSSLACPVDLVSTQMRCLTMCIRLPKGAASVEQVRCRSTN